MRLRLRLFLLILLSLWRKQSKTLDESVLSLRVLPNDIDITRMTNDRYLALMDLGRVDFMLRAGMLKTLLRKKWVPCATCAAIRFRHSLKVFREYLLRTRIMYWDEKRFYLQQHFERKGRIVATGYLFGVFIGPDGSVRPGEVLEEIGAVLTKPEKPDIVARLQEMDELIHQVQHDKDPTP